MIFRLDIRKCFLTQQVTGNWDSPPTQGSGDDPKAVRAHKALGQHFQADDEILGVSVQGRELDLLILMGPFQLSLFYDSVTGMTAALKHGELPQQRNVPHPPGTSGLFAGGGSQAHSDRGISELHGG